jgi:phage-related minor tail protein
MADIKITVDSSEIKRATQHTTELEGATTRFGKKLSPLLAKEREFGKAVKQVNDAMRLGVATQKQAIAEIERLGKAYGFTETQINRVTASMTGVRKNTNRMNATIQNAGYQFGDFFVQVQSGQNALVAFSQQGAQLAGLLPGVAGAVAGVALVLGSSLARALMETSGLFKTFSEASEESKEAIDGLISSVDKFSDALDGKLGPGMARFAEVIIERNLTVSAEKATIELEKLRDALDPAGGTAGRAFDPMGATVAIQALKNLFKGSVEARQELVKLIDQINQPLNFDDAGQLDRRLDDIANLIDKYQDVLTDPQLEALIATYSSVYDRQKQITDEQAAQSEELETILDVSDKILSIDKERASLAESIEETFEKTAKQAKLMQQGMDRGMSSQVASMQMRLDKEKGLLAQLVDANIMTPLDAAAVLFEREQGFEQYTTNLATITAKKSTKGAVTKLSDAEKAIESYDEALNRLKQNVAGDFANTIVGAFQDISNGTKTVGEAFNAMARQMVQDMMNILIFQPLMESLTSSITSAMGGTPSSGPGYGDLFGGGGPSYDFGSGPEKILLANVGGTVKAFANGGIISSPTMSLMGEAGPEAVLPLKRGANGKLGVEGGGNVTVNQTFQFAANGDESVKRIIAEAAPAIAKMTEAQIVNSRQRGGSIRRAFN